MRRFSHKSDLYKMFKTILAPKNENLLNDVKTTNAQIGL